MGHKAPSDKPALGGNPTTPFPLHGHSSASLPPQLGMLMAKPRAHQEDEGWVSNKSDGCGQLPLVAPAVGAGRLVSVLGQFKLLQCPLHHLQGGEGCDLPLGTQTLLGQGCEELAESNGQIAPWQPLTQL